MSRLRNSQPTPSSKQTYFQPLLWLVSCFFAACILFTGCADDGYAGSKDQAFNDDNNNASGAPSPENAPQKSQTETALANRQVERANQLFKSWLAEDSASGQAAAGLALTDLLLILDSLPVIQIMTQNLGARSAVNSDDLLYGSDGILYWLSRGVSWQDQGQFQGVLSLLEKKLPWTRFQLESITNFSAKLTTQINLLVPHLINLTDELQSVENNIQIALADPDFKKLYIPGELFHDTSLELTLGHSELAFIQSALAATRAAIHFGSAYQQDWTLEKAFGPWRRNPQLDSNDPLFLPAFGPDDYSVRYLDQRLFREAIRPGQHIKARLALADSLKHAQKSIKLGLNSDKNYVLEWKQINSSYLQETIQLLGALESALFQPTDIPFTEPPTRADFSSLFDDQKHLDTSIPWMIRVDQNDVQLSDDSTAEGRWIMNPDAQKAFFLDGIYTPFPKNDQFFPALQIDELYKNLLEPLLNTYIEHVEDAYLLAR